MASLPAQHPRLALHLTDRALTPLISSSPSSLTSTSQQRQQHPHNNTSRKQSYPSKRPPVFSTSPPSDDDADLSSSPTSSSTSSPTSAAATAAAAAAARRSEEESALTNLTSTALSAYDAAKRLGKGAPLRTMVEYPDAGLVVLHSYMCPMSLTLGTPGRKASSDSLRTAAGAVHSFEEPTSATTLTGPVQGAADVGNVLPEVDSLACALGNTLGGELELLVDVLVRSGGTEAVQAELLVRVALPAHGGHDLNGQGGDAVGQDRQAVVLGLGVEHLEAGEGDNTGLDALLLELLDGVDGDAHLGTGGHQGDVGLLDVVHDVTTLGGLLDGGVLELGEVLSGQGQDRGSVLGGQGNVVSSAGLVAIGGAPHHAVGEGTEVGQSLDRLVGRTVLTKTDRVVGGDPDNTVLGERGQTHGTGGVGDEVEESTTVGDDGAVGGETVEDGTHSVLTDTVADVTSTVVAQTGGRGLEVDSLLPPGEVGASQICGTTNQLGDDVVYLLQNDLGQLSRSNGIVLGGVDGQGLLPALGKLIPEAAGKVLGLGLVLLAVLGEQLVPLLLLGGAGRRLLVAQLVDLLGNGEALLGVEAPLLLQLLDVISLEGGTVDTVGALVLRAEANDGPQLDQGGLALLLLGLLDGGLDGGQVAVTIGDLENLPAVGLVSLLNILSEGLVGVTVDGDVVVIPDGDQVAELQVTGQGGGLRGDTLHQATITEEAVCVVVDQVKAGLVVDSGSVSLADGETDGIADTLTKRTSGDLNTGGVMGLGMAGGDAVDVLRSARANVSAITVFREQRSH
ncbi:hypothetical protein VPNG_10195 [Cytospora leucostoma]|uniref:Uncharacterized protein n=1 Tax=Cytospora leucostoma TaxID=1230097 RepID=A0A423VD82_9PEZI|nr:hypothetical protein VPNG_10195 [Cytospora leucostoma]